MPDNLSYERVVDYFFVCGLPRNKPCQLHSDPNQDKQLVSLKLKAAILDRFPDNNRDCPWDHTIETFLETVCHPGGIEACIGEGLESRDGRFHSFPLTDVHGHHKYIHVLTFYEPMPRSTNRDKIQEILSQVIDENSQNVASGNIVYAQKSICAVTRHPYINTCRRLLSLLHGLFVQPSPEAESLRSNLPIESYIFNLLHELPLPTPGSSVSINWGVPNDEIVVQRPSLNELPLLDVHLSRVFQLLKTPQNVLSLLTSALLEHQIILLSEDHYNLIAVAEGIMSLMIPFVCVASYMVIPSDYKSFIDSPVPYVIGFMKNKNHIEEIDFSNPGMDQCIVDLDAGTLRAPEDQPIFPMQQSLCVKLTKIVSLFHAEKMSKKIESSDNSPSIKKMNVSEKLSQLDLEPNATVARVTDIAKRVGVVTDDDLHASITPETKEELLNSPMKKLNSMEFYTELSEMKLNTQIREEIFSVFISVFSQYDKFVIYPENDEDAQASFTFSRNFDKASFLAEQQHSNLKFLSAFLETQAFANFVNPMKEMKTYVELFNNRCSEAFNWAHSSTTTPIPIDQSMLMRSFSVNSGNTLKNSVARWTKNSNDLIEKRLINVEIACVAPHALTQPTIEEEDLDEGVRPGMLPLIRNQFLSHPPTDQSVPSFPQSKPRRILEKQQSAPNFSPDQIAQNNWRSLERFLKDVKSMTKRLLVGKMGQEAHDLGHSNLIGLEENTLLGKLCDLLERVWLHGLHHHAKRGRSSLWSHLLQYEENQTSATQMSPINPGTVLHLPRTNVQYSSASLPRRPPKKNMPQQIRTQYRDDSGLDNSQVHLQTNEVYILPLNVTILSNIRRIKSLNEAQTDAGKCRAWIRLLLEQKQLHLHLTTLLSDTALLKRMYKRYSLLQCEDHREQFLYHIMSLKTVDFNCFTNSFLKTDFIYRVWIFPRKQFGGFTQTTATVNINLYGENSETGKIVVSKGCTEFSFKHQNIGVLSAMTIGHDNSGMSAKWFVEFVLVRNETTGQAYNFSCGRWLGKSVDDGSLQRLLIAQQIPQETDLNLFINSYYLMKKRSIFGSSEEMLHRNTSSNVSLSSIGRTSSVQQMSQTIPELQESVGECVNMIVKLLLVRTKGDKSVVWPLTSLLCGTYGLIPTIQALFLHGLKSGGGIFKKRLFSWDIITTVCEAVTTGTTTIRKTGSHGSSLASAAINSFNGLLLSQSGSKTLKQPQMNQGGGVWVLGGDQKESVSSSRNEDASVYTSPFSPQQQNTGLKRMVRLANQISHSQINGHLGQDDMFALLMCIGAHEKYLAVWIVEIAKIPQVLQLYEDFAFIRDPSAVQMLSQTLSNLNQYEITLSKPLYRDLQNILK